MAALVAWFASFFGGAIASLATYFGKKYAFAAVYAAAWISFAAIFTGIINGLLAGLSFAAPGVGDMLAMLPSNLSACTGMIVSAHTAGAIYSSQVNLLSLKSRV